MRVWVIVLLLLAVTTGCPRPRSAQRGVTADSIDPEATRLMAVAGDSESLRDELKRLQGEHSTPANPAVLGSSNADQRWSLAPVAAADKLGFSLTAASGETWELIGLDRGGGAAELENVAASGGAAGFTITGEFGNVAFTLDAVWTAGRVLELSREYIMLGANETDYMPPSCSSWTLSGPPLPYRLMPAMDGPFGLLSADQANGDWHGERYPNRCIVPAVGAFGQTSGFILGVIDQHPRVLDRAYEMAYRSSPDALPGPQIKIGFLSEQLEDGSLKMAAGDELRDKVALLPVEFAYSAERSPLLEPESRQMIDAIAALVQAYHLSPPDEPARSIESAVIARTRPAWITQYREQVGGDVLFLQSDLFAAGDPDRTIAESKPAVATAADRPPVDGLLEQFAGTSRSAEWAPLDEASITQLLKLVSPPAARVVWHDNPWPQALDLHQAGIAALLSYRLGADPEAVICAGHPARLASYGGVDCMLDNRAEGLEAGLYTPSRRLAGYLLQRTLGQRSLADIDAGSLAELLLALGEGTLPVLADSLGIGGAGSMSVEAAASLSAISGDLGLLHWAPEINNGETIAPLHCTELVGQLPARDPGPRGQWIFFLGTGGRVSISPGNDLLVTWDNGGQWTGKLPPGIWQLEGGAAEQLLADGEAAWIHRRMLGAPGSGDSGGTT